MRTGSKAPWVRGIAGVGKATRASKPTETKFERLKIGDVFRFKECRANFERCEWRKHTNQTAARAENDGADREIIVGVNRRVVV